MTRSFSKYAVLLVCAGVVASGLAGCGVVDRPERPAWRGAAERACLSQKLVKRSAYVTPRPAMDGPGMCGLDSPFYVTALANGSVKLHSRATLNCPMIAALDRWVSDVVQPAARARFGQPVVEISTMGSYGCRRRNHNPGSPLSEHAFGNALDIGAFTVGDGRKLKVVQHWRRGDPQEQAFMRETHAGACRYFRTVLGPGVALHDNHFHFDLAMHGNTSRGLRRYCRPVIKDIMAPPSPRQDNLPDHPFMEPDFEMARRLMPKRTIALNKSINRLPPVSVGEIRLPPPGTNVVPQSGYGGSTYGRLRPLEPGAPLALDPLPPRSGTFRSDGVYVPPGR
ncbi:MAG: extensin family protein [Beijerinckiaceae bacterium]